MKKILKNRTKITIFKCKSCGTIFASDEKEYVLGFTYSFCPTCDALASKANIFISNKYQNKELSK